MLLSYIRNLTLFHKEHDDLLENEQRQIYTFMMKLANNVNKIARKSNDNQGYLFTHLKNNHFLFVRVNKDAASLDKQPCFFLYDTKTRKFYQSFPYRVLKPLLKESVQLRLSKNATRIFEKEKLASVLNPKQLQAMDKEMKESVIRHSNFTGWDNR